MNVSSANEIDRDRLFSREHAAKLSALGYGDGATRECQLLAIVAMNVAMAHDQLRDLVTLTQQQNDLLRRIVSEEHAP
jgi:hypothetical protein